jgi:capsule synthesis protein, capA
MFNTIQKIIRKKRQTLFIVGILLCAAAFTLIVLRAFFRPVRYVVHIDDALFEKYVLPLPEKAEQTENRKLPFTFKKRSETAKRSGFFGKIEVTAATVLCEKNILLLESDRQADNITKYPLEKTVLLPSVKAEFEKQSEAASVLNPNLSVSITEPSALPEKNRALPVDGLYAGDENYALTINTYAVCTVYSEAVAKALAEWCEKTFVSPEDQKTLFIAGVGDIMVARGLQDVLINDPDGLKKVFSTTLPVLQSNDLTIGNLEGVVTESSAKANKTYTFKFKKAVLPFLKDAGFNYLMQANNHCYDYGESGFKDTLAALDEYSVPTSGAGLNEEEAAKFYNTEIKGQKVAVISCGAFPVEQSGFNGKTTATATKTRAGILWEGETLLKSIAEQKTKGNFVVVNVHGGEEYRFSPTKRQRALYESFCDSGADVVFGSHPHVLQPTEWYKNGLIVYSLGNFLFNGMTEMYGATDSEIARLGIYDGKIVYVELYPVKLGTSGVALK